jgi:peroxiredoxin
MRYATFLEEGAPAPEFELPVLGEAYFSGVPSKVRLADLQGRYVILNFWAVHCAPCMRELPDLTKIWREYETRGLSVLGVLSKSDPRRGLEREQRYNPDGFPSLVDLDGALKEAYLVNAVPRTYIVGPGGAILFSSGGWSDEKRVELVEVLDRLLRD